MQRAVQVQRPPAAARRGLTAVLAMVYLVLFSALAVGFFAAVSTATQVVYNDQAVTRASFAAESGMEFMRYQLGQLMIPHGTQLSELFPTFYSQLSANINGTANLSGQTISRDGVLISIPADPNACITLDSDGARFRATIEDRGQLVRVTVGGMGSDNRATRAIQMDYGPAQRSSAIFDFGIASKGKVVTDGVSRVRGATDPTKGSILSTTMTQITAVEVLGKEVSGEVSISNPNGVVVVGSGSSIGGTADPIKIAEHIHKDVPAPEFPTIDISVFEPYVTNTYAGGNVLINARIPANTNPTFAAGATLQGVILIETPNVVTFRGNTDLQGVIVAQKAPTQSHVENILDFRGNITARGVGTLPESFGDLRKLSGAVVLAPKFHVRFSGNFGEINGHLLGSKFTFDGNATGTIYGSIVNLEDTQMLVKGSSEIIIASTGTTNYPAGVYFSSNYVPLRDTYEEVQP